MSSPTGPGLIAAPSAQYIGDVQVGYQKVTPGFPTTWTRSSLRTPATGAAIAHIPRMMTVSLISEEVNDNSSNRREDTMPELYYDRRHLHDDGYIDQYRWHMVDTNLLENDIDEALGRGSHLDRRIARKIPLARRIVRRSHSSHAPANSSFSSTA